MGTRKGWVSAAIVCALLAACVAGKEEAPGFVRVAVKDGKWWLLAEGRATLSKGVNCVLPKDGAVKRGEKDYYNVLPRYGDKPEAWAAAAEKRLRGWGFNTAASWSDDAIYARPILHTRCLWLGNVGGNRLIDVFDEKYAREIDRQAKESVSPHKDDRWLIGWYINNELPWYGDWGWPTSPDITLLSRYFELPGPCAGKREVVKFLRAHYGDSFPAFAAEWQCPAKSFDAMGMAKELKPRRPRAALAVASWAGIVAERYFALTCAAIRKYDPNHLILGVRIAGSAPAPVLRACAKHCDVFSLNYYMKSGHIDSQYLRSIYAVVQKPILLTEFSYRAMENRSGDRNEKGADVTVATQKDRAACATSYITELISEPYVIGYHWFQYFDQPASGRSFDGENSNYGVVDVKDKPYEELLAALGKVNADAEKLHAASRVPLPAADSTAIPDFRPVSVRTGEGGFKPASWLTPGTATGTYGDGNSNFKVEVARRGAAVLAKILSGDGWGAGLQMLTAPTLPTNGKAVNLLGARRVVITLKAPKGFRFIFQLNESGHGAAGGQTYNGEAQADGEAYQGPEMAGTGRMTRYEIELEQMTPNTGYGNQRGNKVVDVQAVDHLGFYFPSRQKGSLEVKSVVFE